MSLLASELNEGETIKGTVAANLFRGVEAVGGSLTITDRRIIFKPHPFNIQRKVVEIPLSEITDVRERKTLGIVPNGILVTTKSGAKYKFVVWHRKDILDLMKNEISALR